MSGKAGGRARILFLSSWFPFPADNGSKIRIRSLLTGLTQKYDVILLSFIDRRDPDAGLREAHTICREVHVVPFRPYDPGSPRARLGFLSPMPRSFRDTFSPAMASHVKELTQTHNPDVVIASQLGMALYRSWMRSRPALFEEVEAGLFYAHYINAATSWERLRAGLTWWKHRRFLDSILGDFQECTVVSETERDLVKRLLPNAPGIEVIPNAVNLAEFHSTQRIHQPNTLIFTGPFTYGANYEAMVWFVRDVFPEIKARVPETRLIITGRHDGHRLPDSVDVHLAGHVQDVRPLVAGATVSIAPLLSGGGTRTKIIEAMALRTAVVATGKGAEGLSVEHDHHILIADSGAEFADNVVRLLREPETRARLTDNAYRLVQQQYEWAVVMPRFIRLVDDMVRGESPRRGRLGAR